MSYIGASMSGAEFGSLIDREHERVELKSGVGRRPLQATLVAMSNADGGMIFVGVSDDRRVVGCQRSRGLDDDVYGAAADASNVGRLEIGEMGVDGRTVVIVEVQPRTDEVAATSDGRVLARRGGHNRALSPKEVAELYSARARVRFDSTDSGVSIAEVDDQLARELATVSRWTDEKLYADRWRERGLVHQSGNLSVAGALVLTNPEVSLSAAKFRVDLRVYESDTESSYVNREVMAGPVHRQVSTATDLVTRFVGTEMVITGARRHDVPRLPHRVVREAIANAVAHRTYELDSTPVVIEVRPSSVVIESPGGLPEPVTVATLRQAQAPRNHIVIEMLRRFGLAEDSGQGIDVIEDGMRFEMLAEPEFAASPQSFTVRLPLRGLLSTAERGWLAEFERAGVLRSDERALLLIVAREQRVANSRARDVLGVDSTEARTRLHRLRDAGILVQHGTRGRAYYTLGTLGPERTDQQVVLEAARVGPITNERVRELTGLDRTGARALLRRLVHERLLAQHGERRGTFYTAL